MDTFVPGTGKKVRKNIPKDEKKLAEALALKKYYSETLHGIEVQSEMISELMRRMPDIPNYPNGMSDKEPEQRKLLDHVFDMRAKAELSWKTEPYEKYPDYPENLTVNTDAGEMVRSKSEALIANMLYSEKIPFHYEQALKLGSITVYPDFTIPGFFQDKGCTILWEHFGLLDNRKYRGTMFQKLGLYLEYGFIPGHNLIITCETGSEPLDTSYVKWLIAWYWGF